MHGTLLKEELAILGFAFPTLIDRIAEVLNLNKEEYKKICNLGDENLLKAVIYFRTLGVYITEDDIPRKEEKKVNVLTKFFSWVFKRNPSEDFIETVAKIFKESGEELVLLSALQSFLVGCDWNARTLAINILGRTLKDSSLRDDSLEILIPFLKDNPNTKECAINVIGSIFEESGNLRVFDILVPYLRDDDETIKRLVANAIGNIFKKSDNDITILKRLLTIFKNNEIKEIWVLSKIIGVLFNKSGREKKALEFLQPLLKDSRSEVKEFAINCIGKIYELTGDKIVLNVILPFLNDKESTIKSAVTYALTDVFKGTGKENLVLQALSSYLKSKDVEIKSYAIRCIGDVFNWSGNEEAIKIVKQFLYDDDRYVKRTALEAIGSIYKNSGKEQEGIAILESFLNDKDEYIKTAVKNIIEWIS